MNIIFDRALQQPVSVGESAKLSQEPGAGYQIVTSVRSVPDHDLPVWHISIFRGGLPVPEWTDEQLALGIHMLRNFCKDLDDGRNPITPGKAGVHFIKELNDKELGIIDPNFMAKHMRYRKWLKKVSANAVKSGHNPQEVTPANLGRRMRHKTWRHDEVQTNNSEA